MLEKYCGWLVCTVVLLLFSILLAPFQVLVDWFAPVIGVTIGPTLGIVFLMFVSGLKYPLVLVAWALSGFACGAIGRGGIKRAIILPLAAFLTLFLILGANVYPIIVNVFSSGGFAGLPSPPPGVTVADLLSLPLVVDLAPAIQGVISPGAGTSGIIATIITTILSNMVVNLVTLCAFSVLGCLVTTKVVPRIRKKTIVSLKTDSAKIASVACVFLLVMSSALPLVAYASPVLDFTIEDVSSPQSVYSVGNDVWVNIRIRDTGNVTISSLTATFTITKDKYQIVTGPTDVGVPKHQPSESVGFSTASPIWHVPSDAPSGSYDLTVTLEASSREGSVTREYTRKGCFQVVSTSTEVQQGGPFAVSAGESLFLQIQTDGSLSVAYAYGGLDLSAIGIAQTDLQGAAFAGFVVRQGQVKALEQLGTMSSLLPEIGFVGLYEGIGLEEARTRADHLASQFGAAFNTIFHEASSLEMTVMNETLSVVIYSAPPEFDIAAAFNACLSLLPSSGLSKLLIPDKVLEKPFIAMIGSGGGLGKQATNLAVILADWGGDVFSGAGIFSFSLKEILGFAGEISSSVQGGSVIMVQLPESLNTTSLSVTPPDAMTNGRMVSLEAEASKTYGDLQIAFKARFPPRIEITKNIQPSATSAGGLITVTLEVRNSGNETVTGVNIDDGNFLKMYGPTVKVISGSTTGATNQLGPGQTKTIEYSVKVEANGKYTLDPANVTYSDNYGTYSKMSETIVVTSTFNIVAYLQTLFMIGIPGSATLGLLSAVNPFIIALLIIIVVPLLRELWRAKRSKHEPAKPEPLKPPAEKEVQDPLMILKTRYANGEITKEQYEEMKRVLEQS